MAQLAGRLTLTPGRVFPIIPLCFELIPVPGQFVDEPLEALNPGPGVRKFKGLCAYGGTGSGSGSQCLGNLPRRPMLCRRIVWQLHQPTVSARAVRLLLALELTCLEAPAHRIDTHA